MSERKHTPGPWVQIIKHGKSYVVTGPYSEPFVGQVIANETTCRESVANHTLIAAAPELLEAVSWFIDQLQGDSGTGDSYWSEFPEYRAALAAYSKATGGAPNGGAS